MTLSPTLIGAVSIFVAMGLMRMTYRNANRGRPDGIRWRGINWSRDEAKDEDAPTDPPAKGDDGST